MRAPKRKVRRGSIDSPDRGRRLAERLAPRMARRLALALTDNRTTMIAVRREPDRIRARVHHMFADAPADVVAALADYLERNDDEASRLLSEYIDRHQDRIRRGARAPGPVAVSPVGRHHDLAGVFGHLNRVHLGDRVRARITWGPRIVRGRTRRSIKLGSYAVEQRLIRVHPALDRDFVPRFFVEWIVFHEMLHALHPIPTRRGRRLFHTAEFLAHERRFPHFARARRWERENLDRLLDY